MKKQELKTKIVAEICNELISTLPLDTDVSRLLCIGDHTYKVWVEGSWYFLDLNEIHDIELFFIQYLFKSRDQFMQAMRDLEIRLHSSNIYYFDEILTFDSLEVLLNISIKYNDWFKLLFGNRRVCAIRNEIKPNELETYKVTF